MLSLQNSRARSSSAKRTNWTKLIRMDTKNFVYRVSWRSRMNRIMKAKVKAIKRAEGSSCVRSSRGFQPSMDEGSRGILGYWLAKALK